MSFLTPPLPIADQPLLTSVSPLSVMAVSNSSLIANQSENEHFSSNVIRHINVLPRVTPVPLASDPQGMVEVKYTVLAFYLVTFVAGLIGNTLVLYVIARYSEIRTRSVSNYYIWNLALADELFVLSLPFFCYATWTGNWIFGSFTCKVLYVFRECNKFASVLTLCALSIDRFLASFHHFGKYRQIRVGTVICAAIWTICFASSTPYWMFASVAQSRPPPNNICRSGGTGNSIIIGNNTTGRNVIDGCCGYNNSILRCTTNGDVIGLLPVRATNDSFHQNASFVGDDGGSVTNCWPNSTGVAVNVAYGCDVSGETVNTDNRTANQCDCRSRMKKVAGGGKLSCRMNWPAGFRKSWTFVQLVLGVFIPLVAIAIFNGLLLRRLQLLNAVRARSSTESRQSIEHQQHALEQRRDTMVPSKGASRVQRLTSVSRMMLAVVTIFVVCQLPYHVMEIISLAIEDSRRLPSAEFAKVFIYCNMIAQIMVFLSSCINPIVYGVFNKNYRKLYKQVLIAVSSPCRTVSDVCISTSTARQSQSLNTGRTTSCAIVMSVPISVRRLHNHDHRLAADDVTKRPEDDHVSEPDVTCNNSAGRDIEHRRRLPVCYCCSCLCAKPVAGHVRQEMMSVEPHAHVTRDGVGNTVMTSSGGHQSHSHRKAKPRRAATFMASSSITVTTDQFSSHPHHKHQRRRHIDARPSISNVSL